MASGARASVLWLALGGLTTAGSHEEATLPLLALATGGLSRTAPVLEGVTSEYAAGVRALGVPGRAAAGVNMGAGIGARIAGPLESRLGQLLNTIWQGPKMNGGRLWEVSLQKKATAMASGIINGKEVRVIATRHPDVQKALPALLGEEETLLPFVKDTTLHPDEQVMRYLLERGATNLSLGAFPRVCPGCQNTAAALGVAVENPRPLIRGQLAMGATISLVSECHRKSLSCCGIRRGGEFIFATLDEKSVVIHGEHLEARRTIANGDFGGSAVSLSPDGEKVVVSTQERLLVFAATGGKLAAVENRRLKIPFGGLAVASFSNDTKSLLFARGLEDSHLVTVVDAVSGVVMDESPAYASPDATSYVGLHPNGVDFFVSFVGTEWVTQFFRLLPDQAGHCLQKVGELENAIVFDVDPSGEHMLGASQHFDGIWRRPYLGEHELERISEEDMFGESILSSRPRYLDSERAILKTDEERIALFSVAPFKMVGELALVGEKRASLVDWKHGVADGMAREPIFDLHLVGSERLLTVGRSGKIQLWNIGELL